MNRRYMTLSLLILATTVQAQITQQNPRLVVNIIINQLTMEYLKQFAPYLSDDGLKRMLADGLVYKQCSYPFAPTDNASAIATYYTGTTPYYHGIVARRWLDRNTLRLTSCTADNDYVGIYTTDKMSPKNLLTSTITDELKVATNGQALVFSVAADRESAILAGGHAADGAFWVDAYNGSWCTSSYYTKQAPSWLSAFNKMHPASLNKAGATTPNIDVTAMALACLSNAMSLNDETPDMLNIAYDLQVATDSKASQTNKKKKSNNKTNERSSDIERLRKYQFVDQQIATLIKGVTAKRGLQQTLFLVTGTGYCDDDVNEYAHYRVPSGTFYINRTANLLNMYLGALYGNDHYVDGCAANQIYLNHRIMEQKRLNMSNVLTQCQLFLLQCEGVRNAYTSENLITSGNNSTLQMRNGVNTSVSGDLLVEVAPGWKLCNEDTQEQYNIHLRNIEFPFILYGCGVQKKEITTPIDICRVAPTIAASIHIRAPNACSLSPLP